MSGLSKLQFDNRFTQELSADSSTENRPRQVFDAAYSRVKPTKVAQPQLVHFSREVAELIGLTATDCGTAEFASVFGGNQLVDGMDPFAMCYGGHQFGNWAGQLGDGRAINLGEVQVGSGDHWALQLKGAGITPYSRTADGLAVLRSSVREFLCSEAMFHLGVPTTRALSLVLTGDKVLRDMFYQGNPEYEPGAIVCRVAPSFIRFGNFQIFAAREDHANLKKLVEFTMRNDFGHEGTIEPTDVAAWFFDVCQRTCEMVIHWMRVGFVHGVMNTDNMSILGLTIDYGPYGWLEGYDPGWTPNTTDAQGKRYRFGNQPLVAHWNLYQLGMALMSLVGKPEPLQEGLDKYLQQVTALSNQMMGQKLGLENFGGEDDESLKQELFEILVLTETDMTIWFRNLAQLDVQASPAEDAKLNPEATLGPLLQAYYTPQEMGEETLGKIAAWLERYRSRVLADGQDVAKRAAGMNAVNPKYVLRNYMAQQAIDQAEQGEFAEVRELLELLRNPYDEQPEKEKYFAKRPEWARHRPGCSMLSCSS